MTDNIYEKLIEITTMIIEEYDYVKSEIKKIQEINEKITGENINYILSIIENNKDSA